MVQNLKIILIILRAILFPLVIFLLFLIGYWELNYRSYTFYFVILYIGSLLIFAILQISIQRLKTKNGEIRNYGKIIKFPYISILYSLLGFLSLIPAFLDFLQNNRIGFKLLIALSFLMIWILSIYKYHITLTEKALIIGGFEKIKLNNISSIEYFEEKILIHTRKKDIHIDINEIGPADKVRLLSDLNEIQTGLNIEKI